MKRYETLILATPEITADESAETEKQFEQIIKKAQGTIRSFERWGKYKLEYPIWHNEYGVYFLARFEVDTPQAQQLVKDIDTLFKVKLPSLIMRHITTVLPLNHPLTYIKPDSLEDMPAQDVDTLLKENKGKGFMHKDRSREYGKDDESGMDFKE